MAYVDKILLPDERIIYAATLHWVIYLQGLVVTLFGGILGSMSHPLMALLFGEKIGAQFARSISVVSMVIVLVGALLVLVANLRQTSTEIVITNKRLIAKYGIVARATFEILANRITGANFDQSVAGRVFGFGTILVHGAGGEISPIDMVSNPQLFYRALVSVLEKSR